MFKRRPKLIYFRSQLYIVHVGLIMAFACSLSNSSIAQETSRLRPGNRNNPKAESKPQQDEAVRTAALEFVREHQPQVGRLLNRLEQNRPAQYERSVRSLVREVERLQAIKSRVPEKFDVALALWKNQKAIDLITAQLAVTKDRDAATEKLTSLLRERNQLQIESLTLDMTRVQERLVQLKQQKSELESVTDETIAEMAGQQIKRAQRFRQPPQPSNPEPPVTDQPAKSGAN
ncbi:MAG: hypothetical protein R3C03_06405 [Pirellulaceae bacterium]